MIDSGPDATNPTLDAVDRFEHLVRVQAAEIDDNGHANNVVFVRWIQDAAVAHWYAVADRDRQPAVSWVVVRHEVDYKQPAFVGDLLKVQTWVGKFSAATCERHCQITRDGDPTILARSITTWCLIDPSTGRPRRIDATIRGYFCGRSPSPTTPIQPA